MLLRLPSSLAYFKKYLNTVEEKDYTSEKDYDPWFLIRTITVILSTDLRGSAPYDGLYLYN